MKILKKIVTIIFGISALNANAATISGQGFMRDASKVYTCIGTPVYAERIEGKNINSVLEKVNNITWKIIQFQEDERTAKSNENKEAFRQKEKQFISKNLSTFKAFEKLQKEGKIRKTICDTEGKFLFEGVTPGYYVLTTVIRPSTQSSIEDTPVINTIRVKEGHRNYVLLYIEN